MFPINNSHYDDPHNDNAENKQSCVQEECLRQYRDDRVGMRIENPIIVSEEYFMEQDERTIEINGKHDEWNDGKQSECSGGGPQKIEIALFHILPDSNDADYSSDNEHEFNSNEEPFNILEMNAAGS
jgi:hypothetical protein